MEKCVISPLTCWVFLSNSVLCLLLCIWVVLWDHPQWNWCWQWWQEVRRGEGGWVLHDLLSGLAKMELNVVVRLSAVYPAGQNITAISVLLFLSWCVWLTEWPLWLTWNLSCKVKPKKTKQKGKSDWPLMCLQPQGVRRRSFFGVNVAHFVGRQCAGDTTQGVTPPRPPLSLDPLSGMPCMKLTDPLGSDHGTGGCALSVVSPREHGFLSSMLHDNSRYFSSRDDVSALHVTSFFPTLIVSSHQPIASPHWSILSVEPSEISVAESAQSTRLSSHLCCVHPLFCVILMEKDNEEYDDLRYPSAEMSRSLPQ